MKPIAKVQTCYPGKFGIPRQSGLVKTATATLTFEQEFRNSDAIRGLEGFSHIWLIWLFSQNPNTAWSPTVRPPRLGGNKRIGVFATRSPFRPNPIALSAVKLEHIDYTGPDGPTLHLSGVDLMDGTPVLDIKPYIPYADSIPDASSGFAPSAPEQRLNVDIPGHIARKIGTLLPLLVETLSLDPRPSYQQDPDRTYGILIPGFNVTFRINDTRLTVLSAEPA